MPGAGEEDRQPTAILDEDIQDIVARMRKQQLATDQMNIADKALHGRSLNCKQGGEILETVSLGIMQRKLALGVLRGRLSDLPDGLPDLLAPLEGEIRNDVSRLLGGGGGQVFCVTERRGSRRLSPLPAIATPASPVTEQARKVIPGGGQLPPIGQLPEGTAWREPLDRLRKDVRNSAEVPDSVYDDVSSVFEALGLAPLPPRSPRGGAVISSQCTQALVRPASATPLAPGAVSVGFTNSAGSEGPPGPDEAEYAEQLFLAQGHGGFDGEEVGSKASEESC